MADALSIASTPMAMRQENMMLQAQMGILKKSMDAQTDAMSKLLEGMPAAPVNPPHLGNRIDITA